MKFYMVYSGPKVRTLSISFSILFSRQWKASLVGDIASKAVQLHGDFAEGLERSRLLMLPDTVRRGVCVVFTILKAWKHSF